MLATMGLVFFAALIIGVPVAITMGLAGFSAVAIRGDIPLEVTAQRFVTGVDSFPLLAVPFFILAGLLMNSAGITERLVRLANALVGHLTGGLGHVNVVTSMLLAGMSGSAVADAAATSSVLIPAMTRAGFGRVFSAAVTAASCTIGPIVPPSIPFVIFGVMAGVSIGRLFLAGAIPGLLIGLYLMAVVYYLSKRRGYPKEPRTSLSGLFVALKDGGPALLLPLLIVWGIVGGVVTPTEAAVIAVLYSLLLGVVVYRVLTPATLMKTLGDAALISGMVMFIVAGASLLGWMLTREQAGPTLVGMITSITTEPWQVLLLLNIFLLIVGCFVETTALIILLTPVLMPLITTMGIDPVHFGVVFVFNLMIGLITPPVGMAMFVVCSLTKTSVAEFAREIPLFVGALLIVLLIVTYVPGIVLFLPNLLMGS